jgi:SAM-dependent methyltransferase
LSTPGVSAPRRLLQRFVSSYEPFDWYETPRFYDLVFDEDTSLEADFLAAMAARHCEPGKRRALEPACGSGRLVKALIERGFEVTGFDLSRGALSFARERLAGVEPAPTLAEGRMESFDLGVGFDLAHCLVSTFKYLASEATARSHLQAVARALRPGGIYVLGLHLTEYEDRARSRERWVVERPGLKVVCNIQTWPSEPSSRSERLRTRMTVTEDGVTRRFETHWQFRTYDRAQLKSLLRSVPEFEHVETYTFDCDVDQLIELGVERLDNVLVLRRR